MRVSISAQLFLDSKYLAHISYHGTPMLCKNIQRAFLTDPIAHAQVHAQTKSCQSRASGNTSVVATLQLWDAPSSQPRPIRKAFLLRSLIPHTRPAVAGTQGLWALLSSQPSPEGIAPLQQSVHPCIHSSVARTQRLWALPGSQPSLTAETSPQRSLICRARPAVAGTQRLWALLSSHPSTTAESPRRRSLKPSTRTQAQS